MRPIVVSVKDNKHSKWKLINLYNIHALQARQYQFIGAITWLSKKFRFRLFYLLWKEMKRMQMFQMIDFSKETSH